MASIYKALIMEATKCSEEDAPKVENMMRERWRVLDGLDRKEFIKEAKIAYQMVKRHALGSATSRAGVAVTAAYALTISTYRMVDQSKHASFTRPCRLHRSTELSVGMRRSRITSAFPSLPIPRADETGRSKRLSVSRPRGAAMV